MKKSTKRNMRIGDREYAITISIGELDAACIAHLRISFRALFGTRSVCLVRGVTNLLRYEHYPGFEESIAITPKIACAMIARAHKEGWDPDHSRSNFEVFATRETIQTIGRDIVRREFIKQ